MFRETAIMMSLRAAFLRLLLIILCMFLNKIYGSVVLRYEDEVRVLQDKVFTESYRPEVRPVHDLTTPIDILVAFELVAIVEVNDVSQQFLCNGNLVFEWIDERLAWNRTEYGGVVVIHPKQQDVWVPHVAGVNTGLQSEGKRNLL